VPPAPIRLSFVTCNLWLTERWPARAPALQKFLSLFSPDVLALQELQPATRAFIDRVMPDHERIDDPFVGWTSEGNIYWRKGLLHRQDHGAEPVGHEEADRRLFWVRLSAAAADLTLVVACVHLSGALRREESATGLSPRIRQLEAIGRELKRIVRAGEPAVLMGDMNDAWQPHRLLGQAGFLSCFAALGMQSPPTFQSQPTAAREADEPQFTAAIDIIAANRHLRAMAACVPQCFADDLAPSDHWPVQAIYELTAPGGAARGAG
jgi:endonuclease/exonuclease/phosphatase family metal-dependent hydrolase